MKTQQEIKKEFDEIFNHDSDRFYENLKSFIRQIRQDDIKSLIEWAENMKRAPIKILESQGVKDSQGM